MTEEFNRACIEVAFRAVAGMMPFDYGGIVFYKVGSTGVAAWGPYQLAVFHPGTLVVTLPENLKWHHNGNDSSSPTRGGEQATC